MTDPIGGADVTEPAVLRFPDGLPGFPGATHFVLTDLTEDGIFQLLQSVDDPDLSMVVSSPWLFFPDYAPELSDDDERALGIERQEDVALFCSVTADADEDRLFVNLLGPFIVNADTLVGRQVVLTDQEWPVRAPIPAASTT